MEKCTICGSTINKNNRASMDLIGRDILEDIKKYRKTQSICMDCKQELLYAAIISPF